MPADTVAIEVLQPGPFSTIQDLGRPGYAAMGVSRSGAADSGALRLANRLTGAYPSPSYVHRPCGETLHALTQLAIAFSNEDASRPNLPTHTGNPLILRAFLI